MPKHILCSIDLTLPEEATGILLEANKQALQNNAKISVITVLPDYGSSWVGSFFKDGTLRDATKAAQEALKKLVQDTLPDQKNIRFVIEIGVVYEKVLENITKLDADFVVVGAHKPSVMDHLLGPNASRIVRMSPVSTLVVRLS